MKAIEIWDFRDGTLMTLDDLLSALPERILRSAWTVSDYITPLKGEEYFEAHGNDRVNEVANTGERLTGIELASIAKAKPGIIWATFSGYEPTTASVPWIVMHAIDSTFWRCETADIASRQGLLRTFKDARLAA